MEKLIKALKSLKEELAKAKILTMRPHPLRNEAHNIANNISASEAAHALAMHVPDGHKKFDANNVTSEAAHSLIDQIPSHKLKAAHEDLQSAHASQHGVKWKSNKTEKSEVLKFEKNGQWNLGPDKIKPGREHSRKLPKEEK